MASTTGSNNAEGAAKENMIPPELLIVADRGLLKAYQFDRPPNRGPMPRLVESLSIVETHGRYQDEYTDQAGAFPDNSSGGQANSIAERMSIETEQEARSFRRVASFITDLLKTHRPERWGFAAPPEINGAILNGVANDLQERLVCNIRKDLVKTPPEKLLAHLEAA
jgi:hypothetical protein